MVSIKEDYVLAIGCHLQQVVTVHQVPDESTRAANVRTATGVFKRAIQRLAALSVDTDD